MKAMQDYIGSKSTRRIFRLSLLAIIILLPMFILGVYLEETLVPERSDTCPFCIREAPAWASSILFIALCGLLFASFANIAWALSTAIRTHNLGMQRITVLLLSGTVGWAFFTGWASHQRTLWSSYDSLRHNYWQTFEVLFWVSCLTAAVGFAIHTLVVVVNWVVDGFKSPNPSRVADEIGQPAAGQAHQ